MAHSASKTVSKRAPVDLGWRPQAAAGSTANPVAAEQPALLPPCLQFLGDPWHEMPFGNGEVDYASFAVFLNVTNSPWRGTPACATPLRTWPQTADVRYATMAVPDLPAVLDFLRRMSPQALERRQAALERERPKFFYGVAPGAASSALADIVFTNLLSYGQRLAVGEFTE